MKQKRRGLIDLFATHKVAANLLMLIMLLSGVYALYQINTQFLPHFDLNFITIDVVWRGATAEDVERSITTPIEQELRGIDNLKEMQSVSKQGLSQIVLEFQQDADMRHALDQVKEQVALVRDLPPNSEEPIIMRIITFEKVARVLVSTTGTLSELRPYIHEMERQLLDRGIAKVQVNGLPEEEIAIQIPAHRLSELNLSLAQIAEIVRQRSQDVPAGIIGRYETGKQLRSLGQRRDVKSFHEMPLISEESGRLLRLGDIAIIQKRPRDGEVTMEYQGHPAVQLTLFRVEHTSALHSAKILRQWLTAIQPTLPPTIKLHTFDQSWHHIKQRINLLVYNGLFGFILINIVLFLLLNRRVAFWVAMGIPIAMSAATAVLYFAGGTINMVSLFAYIMTLGIIVDDTIVVGEEALSLMQAGHNVLASVRMGAYRMLAPITASSLTTIAAFLPLMLVSGIIGTILLAIPLVVICVIVASLIECFLVLPGHLYHSYRRRPVGGLKQHPIRARIDNRFNQFKNGRFRNMVTYAINNHWLTLSIALAICLFSFGLIIGGKINFTFFPSPDVTIIRANVQFTAGTPKAKVNAFLTQLRKTLDKTDQQLTKKDKSFVVTAIKVKNQTSFERAEAVGGKGEEFAHVLVELTEPDFRDVTNAGFISAWRKNIQLPPNVENFTITAPRPGPPGKDIDVRLASKNPYQLKNAALELIDALKTYPGVSQVQDNLPFGQEQFIYELTPRGKALGFTMQNIGKQLSAAFTGDLVQVFYEAYDEIEVRVRLPEEERNLLSSLEKLPIITPKGAVLPLDNVVQLKVQRGLNELRHTNTELTAHVTSEVDANVSNTNKIIASLKRDVLPKLVKKYDVKYVFEGRAQEQAETLRDMRFGIVIAFALIYIILSGVFASYSLPVLIMVAIPIGLTGAILGHLIMGYDLTILSLFGMFGLSGIVINDSIILVRRYLELVKLGMNRNEAIIEASCQRLRPVVLTSLTTIAGLLPLLFETSLQAQFLIPMAVSISYGLALSTLLVLLVVPALLSIHLRLPKRSYLR